MENGGRQKIAGKESAINPVKLLSDDEVARHVTDMQTQLDACAQSGQAYRVKWRDIKQTIVVIQSLQERLAEAKKWQFSVEEREAAVCPEDVGFDEYIRHLESQLAQVTQERDEQVHQAELAQERLQTAVQLALQGLHERCCEVAALQWFQHEYTHAVPKVRDADEATVFALRKGLPTLTGERLP